MGSGIYISIAAVVTYFLATSFQCCAPHSEPCYKNFSNERDPKRKDSAPVREKVIVIKEREPAPERVVVYQSPPTSPNPGGRRSVRSPAPRSPGKYRTYDDDGNRVF